MIAPPPSLIRMCTDRLTIADQRQLRRHYLNRANIQATALGQIQIALLSAKKWQAGATIKCRFLDGPGSVQQRVVDKALKWTEHAHLTLHFVDSGPAEIRISFLEEGSWSALGTDALDAALCPPEAPTMNFGWLDVGTIDEEVERVVLHEFGHALGCIHEHSSPASGIQWDTEAVYAFYAGPPNHWTREEVDINVFFRYSASVTEFTAFDPTSIMMYDIPAALTLDHFASASGSTLSEIDKRFIAATYPKPVIL